MFEKLNEKLKEFLEERSQARAKWASLKRYHEIRNLTGHISLEDAYKILGYEFGRNAKFGYFDMQARYFSWRTQVYPSLDKADQLKELFRMGRVIKLMYYALDHSRTPQETFFIEQSQALWQAFEKKYGGDAMRSGDIAVREDNCKLFLSHVVEDAPRQVLIDRYESSSCSLEVTYLFHTARERCTSLEEAQQFDLAYEQFFSSITPSFRYGGTNFATDLYALMDHPYSLVLDGTLDKPLPLPGVDIPLSAPSSDHTETVEEEPAHAKPADDHAEAASEEDGQPEAPDDTIYAHAMSVDHAAKVFLFEDDEKFDEEEVDKRYKRFALRDGFSAEMREEIDTAYQVLKAHLEKEMTEAQARDIFEYGKDEVVTELDLNRRYIKLLKKQLSDEIREEIETAYQVLLKIAA